MNPDTLKTAIVALLVLAAIAIGYLIFTKSEKPVNIGKFAEMLANSSKVYILLELRTENQAINRNIMQCGVDFAGSQGLAGKNITTFAIEKELCTSLDGNKSIQSCFEEAEKEIYFRIKKGNESTFYGKHAEIGVGEVYKLKECDVK